MVSININKINSLGDILHLISNLFSFNPENCGNKNKKINITQIRIKEYSLSEKNRTITFIIPS